MTRVDAARLPGCLRAFPGAVLHLAADGTVLDSNGRLEATIGRPLVGAPFAAALDADSSLAKWERVLAEVVASPDGGGRVAELVVCARDGAGTLPEPLTVSVLREPDAEGGEVWVVEHPRDARLDDLRERATEVNTDLANAQRELARERSRLARALTELEARNAALLATSEELARSNRALDEFAHVVSHDLKAPLRSIGNYARWVEEDLGGALAGAARGHVTRLHEQVARMRAMIDGVLDYARAGREDAAPEAVDVGALLREIVALLDPPPGVVVTVDEGMPTLWAARAPLQQVLQNLVDNAVKHAGRAAGRDGGGAHVRVSARPAGEFHEFAVADDGPGIAPRLQERIWTLFHTLRPGGPADGTGIGLAVVRRLVEAQGGRVWVESREGEGATFRFLWRARPDGAPRGGE